MTRQYCDRCGAEVTDKASGSIHGVADADSAGSGNVTDVYDHVCLKCYAAFKEVDGKAVKVRMLVEVGPRERYVIAKYYGGKASRASRAQVRRFVSGALGSSLREHEEAFGSRMRSVAARLAGGSSGRQQLEHPREKQGSLFAGAGEGESN